MFRKAVCLFSLVLLLSMVGTTYAADVWFQGPDGTEKDWDVAANWWPGVPGVNDVAEIDGLGYICKVDGTAAAGEVRPGDWHNIAGSPKYGGTLNMYPGSDRSVLDGATYNGDLFIGYQPSSVNPLSLSLKLGLDQCNDSSTWFYQCADGWHYFEN